MWESRWHRVSRGVGWGMGNQSSAGAAEVPPRPRPFVPYGPPCPSALLPRPATWLSAATPEHGVSKTSGPKSPGLRPSQFRPGCTRARDSAGPLPSVFLGFGPTTEGSAFGRRGRAPDPAQAGGNNIAAGRAGRIPLFPKQKKNFRAKGKAMNVWRTSCFQPPET